MDVKEYQKMVTNIPVSDKGPLVCGLKLSEEVGEVNQLVAKHEFKNRPFDEEFRNHFIEEMGDVLYFLTNMGNQYGITLEEVIEYSKKKTAERAPNSPYAKLK